MKFSLSISATRQNKQQQWYYQIITAVYYAYVLTDSERKEYNPLNQLETVIVFILLTSARGIGFVIGPLPRRLILPQIACGRCAHHIAEFC